jgi:hypothetical protein
MWCPHMIERGEQVTNDWERALDGWWVAYRAQVPALSAAYMLEVEQFAETLRPRFESGELRAFTAADGELGVGSPHFELEELCRAHFRASEIDDVAVALMLQLTPRAQAMAGWGDTDRARLESAIAWDVIAVARRRGWYVPSPAEHPDPLTVKRCTACHHADQAHKPACRVLDCECQSLQLVAVSGYAQPDDVKEAAAVVGR